MESPDEGMLSLACETKRIPLIINSKNEKLTMSGIEEFAIEVGGKKKSRFQRKESRQEESSMQLNEFLNNPYGAIVSGSQGELIDFNLSDMNSELEQGRSKDFKIKRYTREPERDRTHLRNANNPTREEEPDYPRHKIHSQQVQRRKWK